MILEPQIVRTSWQTGCRRGPCLRSYSSRRRPRSDLSNATAWLKLLILRLYPLELHLSYLRWLDSLPMETSLRLRAKVAIRLSPPQSEEKKEGHNGNSLSPNLEKTIESQSESKKLNNSKQHCEIEVFGQDNYTFEILNAAADLARNTRDYQFDLRWTPSPSDRVACLILGKQKCQILQAELLKSVSDVWTMIKDNGLNSSRPVEVITNIKTAPPPAVARLLENLKTYSTRAFPRTVTDYSFKEELLPSESWLVLRSGDTLHEINNVNLMLGSREILDLLKKRLSSISPARFLLGRTDQLPFGTDIPVFRLNGPSPDLDWVHTTLLSERNASDAMLEMSDVDPQGSSSERMTDREYRQTLRELAWLRRLEYSAREIAEQTLTDHVAHAKWEQGQFDLQHEREAESERRAVESANKSLLDLSINIPADSLQIQKDAVSRLLARMNGIQAKIAGTELGEPEKEAEALCGSCLEIVEEKLLSEHKSESRKSTREVVTEAITSALQAPLRFVLPFAFLVVPFIVLFFPVDPSKSDSQIIQNTMRTYGFMLLPLFFLLAASSRWLALQDGNRLRTAKRIELLRSELISKLSAKRADLTQSNTNQMESRSEERKKRREEAGRRIERRLSALNSVRSRINKAVDDARKLRDELFSSLPALKADLAVARTLLSGPKHEQQRTVQ
ncbi:hypothetical protein ACVWXM_006254 [Bradyrhizobium sp. GM7.3]